MQKTKVVIVGGGLAGLSAAYRLAGTETLEIHLFEKNAHLGGRVDGCVINGQSIDAGGFLIYPWYKYYHQLLNDLNLMDDLAKVPEAADYYALKTNYPNAYETGFELSFKDMIEIFIEIFPAPLTDSDPTEPELHAYDDLTIQEFLSNLNLPPEKIAFYLNVFDTYLQGYCYGPVSEVKMAFMAATLFQNIKHGDVHAASYLKNGSKVFINALQRALEEKGVKIYLNAAVQISDAGKLTTNSGEITADYFILCQPPAAVKYSSFITLTVSYTGTAVIKNDAAWGACFYKEDAQKDFSILSIVNLETLYGKKTAQCFNLNIKVNGTGNTSVGNDRLFNLISTELPLRFKGIKALEILNRLDWEKAMPLATENFVESVKAGQGTNNIFYAGDFMGCPSMETALMNGKRAAQQVLNLLPQN